MVLRRDSRSGESDLHAGEHTANSDLLIDADLWIDDEPSRFAARRLPEEQAGVQQEKDPTATAPESGILGVNRPRLAITPVTINTVGVVIDHMETFAMPCVTPASTQSCRPMPTAIIDADDRPVDEVHTGYAVRTGHGKQAHHDQMLPVNRPHSAITSVTTNTVDVWSDHVETGAKPGCRPASTQNCRSFPTAIIDEDDRPIDEVHAGYALRTYRTWQTGTLCHNVACR